MTSSIGSSPLTRPDINASEQSRKDLQDKLNGLGGIGGRKLSAEAKAQKLREACEGFESIFIQKMWQEMRNTIPKNGMMHGREERFWQDMYDQELSKSMTKAGGIGLADMMYEQLSRNLGDASRVAASSVNVGAFTPSAAPLVSEASQIEPQTVAEPQKVASVYDGEAPEIAAQTERDMAATTPLVTRPVPSTPLAAAPVMEPAESTPKQAQIKERPHHRSKKSVDMGGTDLAYLARRDAGDKLGSRAVRPAIHQRTDKQLEAEQARAQNLTQQPVESAPAEAPKPGSPEALAAALESAKAGVGLTASPANNNLNEMVAKVQAENAGKGVMQAAQSEAEEVQPVTRKVTYSTNIPRKNKQDSKQAKQAIRMLNVDNVGVNSKAGQGIAAYHAAQEAQKQSAQPVAGQAATSAQSGENVQPSPAINPLTAKDANAAQAGPMPTIPPLTAANMRS